MNTNDVIRNLEKIFSELGWQMKVQAKNNHTLIICSFPNDNHLLGVYFVISEESESITMYVSYRTSIKSTHRQKMERFILSINNQLLNGCLEIDQNNKEIRYRDGLLTITKPSLKLLQAFIATTFRDALSHVDEIENINKGLPFK